jgi:hypothetical protein
LFSAFDLSRQIEIALGGTLLGSGIIIVGQWWILRKYLRHAVWWPFATLVGALLSFIALLILLGLLSTATPLTPTTLTSLPKTTFVAGETLAVGIAGAILGVCQRLVLWRYLRGSGIWVAASIGAAVVSGLAELGTDMVATHFLGGPPYLLRGTVTGLVIGTMMGGVLALRLHVPDNSLGHRRRTSSQKSSLGR